jgi:uncharacterized protein Yka (UPF0111/DUF47 family)
MTSREDLQEKIKHIEDEIRRYSKGVHFGDPAFSDYYANRVRDIEKLQKELAELTKD